MSCVDNVYMELGGKVSKKKLTEIEDKIRSLGDFNPIEMQQRVTRAGRERIRKAFIQKRNTALMLKAETSVYNFIKQNFKDDPVTGFLSIIGGVQSYKKGTRLSTDLAQKNLQHYYFNTMTRELDKAGLWKDFASGEIDKDVARELSALNTKSGEVPPTKNAKAREIAKILKKTQDYARNRANRAGADIQDLDGFFMTQSHDMFKIQKAGRETWIAETKSRLDLKKSFPDTPDAEVDKILADMYAGFASGKHFKADFDAPAISYFEKRANVGGSISKGRVLHFKSPDLSLEYNTKFGYGSLRETIFDGISKLADKTGLMETLGPNPAEVISRVEQRLGDPKATDLSDKARKSLVNNFRKVENLLSVVDGSASIPANQMMARAFSIVRGIQSMAKLGGAVISSISDIPLAASELKYQGEGFLSRYNDAIIGPYKSVPLAQRKELAMQLGIMYDSLAFDMVGRFSGKEDFSGKTTRMMSHFFKWTGLTGWTNRMRANIALSMSGRLGFLAGTAFDKLEPDLKRTLGLFNIGESEWKALSKAVRKEGDYSFMTPENVADISDADMRAAFGDVDLAAKRQDLSDRLRAYFIDRSEMAVLQPDARTVAILRQGTQPGTVQGELMRSITQFKAFPTAILQKTLGRHIYGKETGVDILDLAETIAMTTAFGYGAMAAKDLLKGREPRDPTDPKTIAAAMMQGGALGIYGDFLLGTHSRFGGGLAKELAGPTIGLAADVGDMIRSIRDGNDPSANMFNLLKQNTPFLNIFYVRAVLDYAIFYRMQEAMNPGYLARMEQRVKDQNSQDFIVKPSSVIPYGGF